MLGQVTALLSVISLFIPLGLGFAIVIALWPRQILRARALQLALSLGIGCGACSALVLAWLVVVGRPGRAILPVEIAAAVLAGWVALSRHGPSGARRKSRTLGEQCVLGIADLRTRGRPRRAAPTDPSQFEPDTTRRLVLEKTALGTGGANSDGVANGRVSRPLLWTAAVVMALAALCVGVRVLTATHGDWDAWASWNMKARMIYLGGDHWRDVFSGLLPDAVPEYPLLLPLSVAGLWLTVGSPAAIAPALLAAAFACATVLTLASGLSLPRSKSQGLLAGAVLAATPYFVIQGSSQYADVPMGFFFVATLVLLALYDREPDFRLLVLAGLTSGFAAWTKNEGLVFLVAVAAARLIFTRRRRSLLWYLAGTAPPMIMVVYLKWFLASASNQMVAGQGLHSTLDRVADLSRYRVIGSAFVDQFARVGDWPISILLLLLFYAVVQGFRTKAERGQGIRSLYAILILMLAAYFSFYLVTPFDLLFHLQVSLNRLMIQLWPSALFVYFLTVRRPEETQLAAGFKTWRKRLMLWSPALILLAGTWASGVTFLALWKTRGLPYETGMTAYERKLSSTKSLMPDRGVVGYTTDNGPLREFFWTQYFLAPLIVVRSAEPQLVVLNRHSPDAVDPPDQNYAVEEHNGMKLYDFGTGIYLEDRRAIQP
jgi:hypothetical protein